MVRIKGIIKKLILINILLIPTYSQARSVTSLNITSIGKTLKQVTNVYEINACKKFVPTQQQAINFFNHAYPVEAYIVMDARYSSCYAEGDLNFSDGSFGTWRLYSSGTATFVFDRGDVVNLFYEHNTWYDPNEGGYDDK